MADGMILKAGMTFLMVFRRKNKRAFPKEAVEKIEASMAVTFMGHAKLGNCVYVATGLNPELFHPQNPENLLEEIHEFIDKLIAGYLQFLGVDDAGLSISMIAPVFASSGAVNGNKNLFKDLEDIFENEQLGAISFDEGDFGDFEGPKPKTKADRWLDNILNDINENGDDNESGNMP